MYLNDSQIEELAQYVCNGYEFTCSWRDAGITARDEIIERHGFKPRSSLVGLVVRRAQLKWEGYRHQAQRAAAEAQQ